MKRIWILCLTLLPALVLQACTENESDTDSEATNGNGDTGAPHAGADNCVFRRKPITHSDPSRSPIPTQADH